MTVVLLRHGRSTSNTADMLAGRSPGVELDDRGREQAQAIVSRLADVAIEEIVHRRSCGASRPWNRSPGPGA